LAIHVSPPTCCSRTKTCPRRAASIPGAGAVRGNLSQLAARFKPGTIRPNTRKDAPHPQKERGQPAGRPPTTCPRPPVTSAISLRCEIAGCATPCWPCGYDAILPRRICETEKSQGIVTLHSEAATEGREGRASEALDQSTTKNDAKSTILLAYRCEFASGRLVGSMKNKQTLAVAAEKPSVTVCAVVNLSFSDCHAGPVLAENPRSTAA
jgi:hypothetical protein